MAKQEKTNSLKIVLGAHRVSYVHVKEPSSFEGGEEKYDVTFLIKKGHEDVTRIKDALNAAYIANKESLFKGTAMTSKSFWNPLRDGDEWLEEHTDAEEYRGCYFIKAASKNRPVCFDRDKQEILDLDEIYSGCYCRGVIVAYPFNNKSRGVGFFLNSLMKIKDGERLGGFEANPDDYDNGFDSSDDDDLL